MNKKALILISLMVLSTIPFISTVQAKIQETDMGTYTEYYGNLGGANCYILIPDIWENPLGNGMLVVICRSGLYVEDPRQSMEDYPFAQFLVNQGIAVAASNYGSSESGCVEDGIIRTHQLTKYVIDNFDVSGKIFLCGTSLGGAVSLILGEKYPDVYSGVLDNSGVKDWAMFHETYTSYSGTDPFLSVFFPLAALGLEERYGGTPEEKSNKYAKYSPTSYTDLSIPVISVIHTSDVIVEPEQTYTYHTLVGDTWHFVAEIQINTPGALPPFPGFPPPSSWYGHFDPLNYVSRMLYFPLLVMWSNGMIPPTAIPPIFPPP